MKPVQARRATLEVHENRIPPDPAGRAHRGGEPPQSPSSSGCFRPSQGSLDGQRVGVRRDAGGELRKVALEAVTAGSRACRPRRAARYTRSSWAHLESRPRRNSLARHGADGHPRVEHARLPTTAPKSPLATAAARAKTAVRRGHLQRFRTGKDRRARGSREVGVPMAADVLSFERAGSGIAASHTAYASKVVQTLTLTAKPAILSCARARSRQQRTRRLAVVECRGIARRWTLGSAAYREGDGAGTQRQPDLADAPVVVSGGRGLRAAETSDSSRSLADAFGNAAVGAPVRSPTTGWRPQSDQIGQLAARSVRLSTWLSAFQGRFSTSPVCGRRDHRGHQPRQGSPISKVADYGIVGDALEVVPALTEAVREAKKGH